MNLQDGVDYLIEAANEIINKRKRSDISFVLIGSGSVQEILARRVFDMGI
jgi:glycogen synthase